MDFIDLKSQQQQIRPALDAAIAKVLDHGQYIMGPEVTTLEQNLADFCGANEVISCSSGTDAIVLPLMALQIGPGDAVFVPSFTFAATAEVVALVGATPVFVDVNADTFNMDTASLERAIAAAKEENLKPKAIIAVDLFGQPANYMLLQAIANANGLTLIADAAQSFGASQNGTKVGALAEITTTSFFPAKPLGCYGDGGAVFTTNSELAHIMRSIRIHGQGSNKYHNVRIGMNGRLDSIQAAILIEKLKIFPQELVARDKVAATYNNGLKHVVKTPVLDAGNTSAWAQYTIKSGRRQEIMQHLKERNIPCVVYYPIPLHQQPAYCNYPTDPQGLLVTDKLAQQVLSLPMHPYLTTADQQTIIASVATALELEKEEIA